MAEGERHGRTRDKAGCDPGEAADPGDTEQNGEEALCPTGKWVAQPSAGLWPSDSSLPRQWSLVPGPWFGGQVGPLLVSRIYLLREEEPRRTLAALETTVPKGQIQVSQVADGGLRASESVLSE